MTGVTQTHAGGRWAAPALAAFVALLGMALVARLWLLQMIAVETLGCRWCVVPGVLKADLPFAAVVTGIFLLSYALRNRAWVLFWRTAAVIGVALYAIDVVVMSQFFTRLMVADVVVFLAEPRVVFGHLAGLGLWWWVPVALGIAALCSLCLTLPRRPLPRRILLGGLAALGLLAMASGLVLPAPGYVHDWAVRNVIDVNRPSGIARPYGPETYKTALAQAAKSQSVECVPGRAQRGPIVLLLLESWSTYHSALWSGLNDWTPRLDAMAAQSLHFPRMHAGGFNTNEALISLFTGLDFVLPMKPARHFEAFDGAWDLEWTLPRRLEDEGYRTVFLTSGNLDFTRKGEWLEAIGFSWVEGHDHPIYEGHPRHHFEAAPDDVLYRRALEVVTGFEETGIPAFMVVENVSTHHPFMHPYTGERGEEAVFRFMDDTAADFIEALDESGFFDRGLLIVISDHRAMTLVSAAEQQLFGRATASLVPAFVMGSGIKAGAVAAPFHQADLVPTVVRHAVDDFCFGGPLRDLLEPERSGGRCLIHARGDRRNHLDVFCPEGEGTIEVAGDNSRFIDIQGLDADRPRALLDRVARERLGLRTEPAW